MKKIIYTIAFLAAAAMLFSCEKDPKDPGKPAEPELSGVDVEEMISKTIKAGDPSAITIKGGDFDEMSDHIWIGWKDADTLALEEVSNASLEIRRTRITFGLDAYSAAVGNTVNVYLKRDGYQRACISGDITVTSASFEDGLIPERQFLTDLTLKNPSIADMVGACSLIDVASAKTWIREPNPAEGWPFDFSWAIAENWKGLELFEKAGSVISTDPTLNEANEGMNAVGWWSPNVKELDLTDWVAPVKIRIDGCKKLEKVIAGPHMYGIVADNCENLKYVDMHLSDRATWLCTSGCSIEYLDIRQCQKGVAGEDYIPMCESGSFKISSGLKNNCLIKIDSYYLIRHFVDNAWTKIYNAWKNGATIEVYSRINIDEKLGTVPSYASDPNALSPTSWYQPDEEAEGYSTNGWKIDDPYTEFNEAAEIPVE